MYFKTSQHSGSQLYNFIILAEGLIWQAIYCNTVMWASVTKMHVCVLTDLHPASALAVKRRKETEISHLNRAFWWMPCWWQMTVFRLAVPPRWQINSYPLDIIMTHFQHQGQSKEQWSKNIECNMFCCTSGRQRTLARRVCIWDCPQGKSRPQHSNHSKNFFLISIQFSWWFLWKIRIELISLRNIVLSVRAYFDFHVSDCVQHSSKILRNGSWDCLFIADLLSFWEKWSSFSV